MDQLVSTEWLEAELGAEDLVVLDCTVFLTMGDDGYISESGRAAWAEAHIPSAGFADLNEDLVDTDSPLRYALPTPRAFADAMQRLGVSDDSRVVLYDGNGSMWAARVWWMLRWIGFDNAALLNGGIKAWKAEDRPLSSAADDRAEGVLSVSERPEIIAVKSEVMAAIGDGATCLIDALPEASYNGDVNAYGRPGHIPGASNAPFTALVDESGRFRSHEELSELFPADKSARVLNYCGGGIAASATAFAQTMLGFDNVAVYTASLQEWVSDPAAPMTV